VERNGNGVITKASATSNKPSSFTWKTIGSTSMLGGTSDEEKDISPNPKISNQYYNGGNFGQIASWTDEMIRRGYTDYQFTLVVYATSGSETVRLSS